MAGKLLRRARYPAWASLLTSARGRALIQAAPASRKSRRHSGPAGFSRSPRNVVIAALSLVKAGIWSALHGHAAPGPPPPNGGRMSRIKDPRTAFRPGYANHGHPGRAQLCYLPASSRRAAK